MPIPGDNGQPAKEKEANNEKVREVGETGANLVADLTQMKRTKTDFGNIK